MSEIAELFKQSVPDADLRLHLLGDRFDLSRYRAEFDNVNGAVLGHQMHFTAASSQYLRRAVADWRSEDSLGTISAWVKRDGIDATHSIFTSSDEASTSYYLGFRISGGNLLEVTQRNNDTADTVRGGTTISADVWYHVALTSDGSAYALYVNGVAETLTVASGANTGDWLAETPNRDNTCIGVHRLTMLFGYFDGNVRVLKYRSRIVPADEMRDEYETQKRAF